MAVTTPLIWYGGKTKMAPLIISHMPNHKCYVEPFGGSAAVMAQKSPVGNEVYNDIDEDVVNFIMCLRDGPERMIELLESLPYARSLYDRWKWEEKHADPFERAIRFFYLNRSAVAAGNNHRSGWRHGKSVHPAKDYHSAIGRLKEFADRFKYVQIECRDALEVIDTYDDIDTLFYVDAPYPGNEMRYKGGFKREDHIRLADKLETVSGKVIVSYYPDELIDGLYNGWRRVEITTFTSAQVVRNGEERPERTELLLMNWDDPQLTLWNYA